MIIIENTTNFPLDGRSAVAIGKFDGIHLGHRKLLEKIIQQKEKGYLATVFTFDTSAAAFFGGDDKELTTREEKRRLFARMGMDVLIEFPLNQETAATPPDVFVEEYIIRQMKAAYICAGMDVSFGQRGAGNYQLLQQYAAAGDYRIEIIDKVMAGGEEVSSTRVREAIRSGEMKLANEMLGTAYSLTGVVAHGRRLGRTIGMPTANLLPEKDKLLPPNGVYYSRVRYQDKVYKAISNIGCKPTVSAEMVLGVESYLYDFTEDIYGKEITVELLEFRRPEMKFADVEALKTQMEKDIQAGKTY
mgnify:FL=1